jgi:hypothetical protein
MAPHADTFPDKLDSTERKLVESVGAAQRLDSCLLMLSLILRRSYPAQDHPHRSESAGLGR